MLHPCPYCGCPDVYVADVEDGMCCVACGNCVLGGPFSVDGVPEEAERGWEILCSRMCRHCNKNLLITIQQLKKELKDERERTGRISEGVS